MFELFYFMFASSRAPMRQETVRVSEHSRQSMGYLRGNVTRPPLFERFTFDIRRPEGVDLSKVVLAFKEIEGEAFKGNREALDFLVSLSELPEYLEIAICLGNKWEEFRDCLNREPKQYGKACQILESRDLALEQRQKMLKILSRYYYDYKVKASDRTWENFEEEIAQLTDEAKRYLENLFTYQHFFSQYTRWQIVVQSLAAISICAFGIGVLTVSPDDPDGVKKKLGFGITASVIMLASLFYQYYISWNRIFLEDYNKWYGIVSDRKLSRAAEFLGLVFAMDSERFQGSLFPNGVVVIQKAKVSYMSDSQKPIERHVIEDLVPQERR